MTLDERNDVLIDALPHGSGINYNWSVNRSGSKVFAYNRYDYMNEFGSYIGSVGFEVVLRQNDDFSYELVDVHLDEDEVEDMIEYFAEAAEDAFEEALEYDPDISRDDYYPDFTAFDADLLKEHLYDVVDTSLDDAGLT